jgi:hypothetical protein
MKTKTSLVCVITVLVLAILACSVNLVSPTPTPQPTYTPQPTFTPVPTNTPPPTATPIPTVEDILTERGFEYSPSLSTCEAGPCRTYVYQSTTLIIQAIVFENGQFRIGFVLTSKGSADPLDITIRVINDIYGQTIADWFNSHFTVSGGNINVQGATSVVDGHWVANGFKKVDTTTLYIFMIIAPDSQTPSGFNP